MTEQRQASKKETLTARQLVRKDNLDIDAVYRVINRYGMDPKRLYHADVDKIAKEISGRGQADGEESRRAIDIASLRNRIIIKIYNPQTRVEYFIAPDDLQDFDSARSMPFKDFVSQVEANVGYVFNAKRTKRIKPDGEPEKPTSGESISGTGNDGPIVAPPKTPKAPRSPRLETLIDNRLAQRLLNSNDELGLRTSLFGNPQEEPIDITYSTALLTQIMPQKLIDHLKEGGLQLESYSPEALMKRAQESKKREVREDVQKYFSEGKGSFLTGKFAGKVPQWKRDDDISDLVLWLEKNRDDKGKGLPFFVNCIEASFSDEFRQVMSAPDGKEGEKVDTLFRVWVMGASQYEFARSHPYSRPILEKATEKKKMGVYETASKIVRDFAHKPQYNEGDARRFMGGLAVARAINTTFQTAERVGNEADYVIRFYDQIGEALSCAIKRIKAGEVRKDRVQANNELCTMIREGKFYMQNLEDARYLGRALFNQLTEDEKLIFKKLKREQLRSDQCINTDIALYAFDRGNEFLK